MNNMTPEQLKEFEMLKRKVESLEKVENVPFIESLLRRLISRLSVTDLPPISLNDLSDVDAPAPTDGQVLKYTTTGNDRWIAGTDNV